MAYIYDLTDTWNAGGTTFNAIKMNVTDSASAVSSKLVTLQTNGTEHFSVTKAGVGYVSGNLGVGTTTPGAKLDVNGQTATGNISVRGDGSEGGQITFSNAANTASALTLDVDNLGHGRLFTSVNNTNLTLGQLVGTGGIVTLNTASAERMRITAAGDVGIGTVSPATKLDVNGDVTVGNGGGVTIGNIQNNGGWFDFAGSANVNGAQMSHVGTLRFLTASAERMRITAAGFVGVGTTAPGAQFENVGRTRLGASVAAAAPSSTDILSTAHTAFSGAGGNYLTIGQYPTGQGFAQWIQSSFNNPTTAVYNLILQPLGGNVGIGTASPTSYTKLTVAGGLQVSGAIGSTASTAGGVISNESPVTRAYIGDGTGFSWAFSSRSSSVTVDRVTIQDSGNVGIGTVSPATKLEVSTNTGAEVFKITQTDATGGTIARMRLSHGSGTQAVFEVGAGYGALGLTTSGPLAFTTNNTERMRIDSSGNVGIGASSVTNSRLQIKGANNTTGAFADGLKVTSNNETVDMQYSWWGINGGAIHFGISGTEKARIDSSGNLLVGATAVASYFDGKLNVAGYSCFKVTGSAVTPTQLLWNDATAGNNEFIGFLTEATPTVRGGINYNRAGGLIAYNTTSDYRAKDIIGPVADAGATIDALKVYNGKMKGATIERPMLIAHEAQEVVPYAVTGGKDAVNEDGTDKYQQMDHQILIPLLIAEIQSLRARVAQLEGN